MNKKQFLLLFTLVLFLIVSFKCILPSDSYVAHYYNRLEKLENNQEQLLNLIEKSDLTSPQQVEKIREEINAARMHLKGADFWLRYLEPVSYKKINGPLPVEWEVEVFEKFEPPYKREGAGLTLASIYLDEENIEKDTLLLLIRKSIKASRIFHEDSITEALKNYHHFFLCNRLFLLNLAAIYTTGFECPDTDRIIPELRFMLAEVRNTYEEYNKSYPEFPVNDQYLKLYSDMMVFAEKQPSDFQQFDHFVFIRDYVNPLFGANQQMIGQYKVITRSAVDYSLNKNVNSIFDKGLYDAQNSKGVFLRVRDEAVLAEIDRVGKLLFYDPILSGNNQRSCASCHKPTEYFTDKDVSTSLQFNRKDPLDRNSPSLINAKFNHLIMLDGKHISLQDQIKDVISNPLELGSNETEVLEKVLSCPDYKKAFENLLQYTPHLKEISIDHISSAITFYYSKFSNYYAPFDQAMNKQNEVDPQVKEGFNIFMSKAQCATCHFVPQFNGVKPPYTNSEFEVLGTPAKKDFTLLSADNGRYAIYPSNESMRGFRTGTIRNSAHTGPYMHNGVFTTLEEVIEFYNGGGGAGRKLEVNNQTLSSDSLNLTEEEKRKLILFMNSLDENIQFETPPLTLPASRNKMLNVRQSGGEY